MLERAFCTPARADLAGEVASVDPTVQIYASSPGRIGCSSDEHLCIGSTATGNESPTQQVLEIARARPVSGYCKDIVSKRFHLRSSLARVCAEVDLALFGSQCPSPVADREWTKPPSMEQIQICWCAAHVLRMQVAETLGNGRTHQIQG